MNNATLVSGVSYLSSDIFSDLEQRSLEKNLCVQICQKELELLNEFTQKNMQLKTGELTLKFEKELSKIRAASVKEYCSCLNQYGFIFTHGVIVEISNKNKPTLEHDWRKKMNGLIQQLKVELPMNSETNVEKLREKIQIKLSSLLEDLIKDEEDEKANHGDILPFYTLTPTQTSKADLILSLLNSPDEYVPSKLAQIPKKNLRDTIINIDRTFFQSIGEYRKSFLEANQEDLRRSKSPRDTSKDFSFAIATGVVRFTMKTPDIPVIREVAGPLLGFAGAISGILNKGTYTKEKIQEELSEHRIQWLKEVLILEEIRLKKAISEVNQRALAIQKKIEGQNKPITLEDDLIIELISLDTFLSFFSPETPLRLKNVSVSDYIFNQLNFNLEESE